MSPPGVSVIIVNWNTRDLVLRLLGSLSSSNDESAHEHELRWQGLRWLLNPSGGLVPNVDRSQ